MRTLAARCKTSFGGRLSSAILPVAVCIVCAALGAHAAPDDVNVVRISNVTVIDATGNPPRPGMNVRVENGYITALQQTPIASSGGTEVDGSGRFLIPGLWDMHVHWYLEEYLPLFVANGVTDVRQMWGFSQHYGWKARVNYDDFVSPRMLIASVIIDGQPKIWPGSLETTAEAQGRRYVRRFQGDGGGLHQSLQSLVARRLFRHRRRVANAGHSLRGSRADLGDGVRSIRCGPKKLRAP